MFERFRQCVRLVRIWAKDESEDEGQRWVVEGSGTGCGRVRVTEFGIGVEGLEI